MFAAFCNNPFEAKANKLVHGWSNISSSTCEKKINRRTTRQAHWQEDRQSLTDRTKLEYDCTHQPEEIDRIRSNDGQCNIQFIYIYIYIDSIVDDSIHGQRKEAPEFSDRLKEEPASLHTAMQCHLAVRIIRHFPTIIIDATPDRVSSHRRACVFVCACVRAGKHV